MAIHSLKMVQNIPAGIETIWELFSNPGNLAKLTMPGLGLRIISGGDHSIIYPGQRIEYKLKPVWGITVHWITEIKEVERLKFFMDIQRKGPYRVWEHRHFFKEIDGGVEMTDMVQYKNPLGILGNMANSILVKKRLKQIFEYRFQQVEQVFGKWEDQQPLIHFS